MLLSCGAAAEADTVICCPFELDPDEPFCTVTVKVPPLARLTGPINCVDVFVSNALLVTVHGEQPVPVNETSTVDGSKPVPVIVKLKD